MAGLLYELWLIVCGVRANGWFCGASRREKGSAFGWWLRRSCSGVIAFGHAVGREWVRGAEGEIKKVHPTRKVQSDEPKIENMDGCLTKSEHGVGASSALVLRLCRGAAARRGVVVWTMVGEGRRATARWWFSVGKGEG